MLVLPYRIILCMKGTNWETEAQQLCVKELGLEAKEVDVYITTTTNTI